MVAMRLRLVASALALAALPAPSAAWADPAGAPFRVAERIPYVGAAAWGAGEGVWVASVFGASGAVRDPVTFRRAPEGSTLLGTDVAYNAARDEFLLVFTEGGTVVARTMAPDGSLGPEVPVSALTGAAEPAVAYNAASGEYLAVWQQASGSRTDVVARRLDSAGTPVRTHEEVRLSHRLAENLVPEVVSGPGGGYLAVWTSAKPAGEDDAVLDVVGQRVTAAGAPTGSDDFRISFHTNLRGWVHNQEPSVAWNPDRAEAYVAFSDGFEIFGQRLRAGGARIGSNARLSTMGPDGDPLAVAQFPHVAFSEGAGGYVVSWWGIDTPGAGGQIHGQHLTGSGRQVGTDDFDVSTCAPAPGAGCDPNVPPQVLPVPGTREYLVVWSDSHEDTAQATFARRVVAP
jgi:hypothetical protein